MNEAIDAALAALDASPNGWLDLPDRRRLRAAYGPWTPPYDGGPDAGLLRRAALAVASARRALGVWEDAFPGDRRPHAIVDAVLPALRGERAEGEVDALAEALDAHLDALGSDPERSRPFYAGKAATTLSWQAWDGDLDPELDPPETRDLERDELLAEALAAYAVGGLEDADAHRRFWRWYVTEAFPAAYAVAP
jgi:hypothetical protein